MLPFGIDKSGIIFEPLKTRTGNDRFVFSEVEFLSLSDQRGTHPNPPGNRISLHPFFRSFEEHLRSLGENPEGQRSLGDGVEIGFPYSCRSRSSFLRSRSSRSRSSLMSCLRS